MSTVARTEKTLLGLARGFNLGAKSISKMNFDIKVCETIFKMNLIIFVNVKSNFFVLLRQNVLRGLAGQSLLENLVQENV